MHNVDLSKYKYISLPHMRNLYAGVEARSSTLDINTLAADPSTVKVSSELLHLAKQLQLSRPRWTFFVPIQFTSSCYFKLFIFQDNDEYLGWVSYAPYTQRYEYDCRILNARRFRGGFNHTTKIEKVRSDILKNFVPKNLPEKFATLYSQTSNLFNNVYSEKVSPYEYRLKTLMSAHHETILERWDDIKHILGTERDSREVASLMEQTETYKQSVKDCQTVAASKFMAVIVSGHTWHTKKGEQEQHYTYDNVPEYIRTAVGMLKLVENGQHVPGFGVRITTNEFSIFTQE